MCTIPSLLVALRIALQFMGPLPSEAEYSPFTKSVCGCECLAGSERLRCRAVELATRAEEEDSRLRDMAIVEAVADACAREFAK